MLLPITCKHDCVAVKLVDNDAEFINIEDHSMIGYLAHFKNTEQKD